MAPIAVTTPANFDLAISAGDEAVVALVSQTDATDRLAYARAFGARSVVTWWSSFQKGSNQIQPLRPLIREFSRPRLPTSVASVADQFGSIVAEIAPELAAYAIGRAYTEMLPADYRTKLGVYYTPPALTARLIEQATAAGVLWETAKVLDPACGGGAFLAPVAQRMMDALSGRSPRAVMESIAARLRGYEIDPFAAWLSQVTLDAVLLPISGAMGQCIPTLVAIRDALHDLRSREQFDLVIGNPPYGRVRLDPGQRARFERSLYGHANLYGMFTDVALQHARMGGVIAYVTPTSFLAGQYFKNLRRLLARDASPYAIDFVEFRKGVFDSVLQETLLATYVRGSARRSVQVHIIRPANGGLSVLEAGMVPLPADAAHPWLLPRKPGDAEFVERLGTMACRLSDWGYEVNTGPLVWNRHKTQLTKEPGEGHAPLIWAEAVTPDGRFEYRSTKRNHKPYFKVRPGDGWLLVDRPCILVQRTTAKEQSRRLIAACLPSSFLAQHGGSAAVENHLNMVRPTLGQSAIVAAEVVAAFLNSAAADRAFRCVSGSVAVSAFELESLPLPAPSELRNLAALVASDAGREEIEAECNRLYAFIDGVPSAIRQPRSNRRTFATHLS